ncbi:MAG TPA: hypothetical protein PK614_06080 [Nitrospira sp.]|nr:hypothetical protein [Nitrospira sp.]
MVPSKPIVRWRALILVLFSLTLGLTGCQKDPQEIVSNNKDNKFDIHQVEDDFEFLIGLDKVSAFACVKANAAQLRVVNQGVAEVNHFRKHCAEATSGSAWCEQLVRPNPASRATFDCTYSASQSHYLIHPNQSTWKHAFAAVNLIGELETKGIRVCQIYNWWRPEPYNANVGGAPGRHPYGTSVDVRFCSMSDVNRAFLELCKMRKAGRLRALGYYGTTALHFGIGDSLANTWGRSCPK